MPIYEYVCRDCGHELEQLQGMSDASLTDCPACGEAALKRKISAAGFRLSGGGWYETDFKSDGRRNIAGSDGQSSGSESSGGDKSGSASTSGDGKSDKSTDKAAKPSKSGGEKANNTGSSASGKSTQGSNA